MAIVSSRWINAGCLHDKIVPAVQPSSVGFGYSDLIRHIRHRQKHHKGPNYIENRTTCIASGEKQKLETIEKSFVELNAALHGSGVDVEPVATAAFRKETKEKPN